MREEEDEGWMDGQRGKMKESFVTNREPGLVAVSGSGLAARDSRGGLFSHVWSVALPPKTLRRSGLFPPSSSSHHSGQSCDNFGRR